MRFELSRGSIHKDRHVLCREGEFYTTVPSHVRKHGPWQLLCRGNVEDLKPEYRFALAHEGWLYVEAHPLGFTLSDEAE